MYLLNNNYADLSFLFVPQAGEPRNEHLRSEYLAVLESNQKTPYLLNLHYQDVGHTLILGMTGSGKSFLCNFLVTHAQKYEPRTFIFDLGGSYRMLTQLFGGSYMQVGIEKRSFTINPFSLPPSEENLHFLFSFVKVLIESSGTFRMKDQHERELYGQVASMYHIDPQQRRLMTLVNILPKDLEPHLARWVQGGQYGALFDNVEDNLSFAPFQTFDFEGLDKYPQILEPLLFYILHRANASIYDPGLATTFKLFLLDEAWRFLKNPTIKDYIVEALKTWRKRNAAMILATQSSVDLTRNEMLQIVAESCGTLMFLANPRMDKQAYKTLFHLNDAEAQLIAGLEPKKQMLVKRPDLAKVVQLNVSDKGLLALHELGLRQRTQAGYLRAAGTSSGASTSSPRNAECRSTSRNGYREYSCRLVRHGGFMQTKISTILISRPFPLWAPCAADPPTHTRPAEIAGAKSADTKGVKSADSVADQAKGSGDAPPQASR